MTVLVMYAIAPNEQDLRIVMTAKARGVTMVSGVVTIPGRASNCNGNPFVVYGEAVEKFTGRNKFTTTISVFGCTSGNLNSWE